MIQLWIDTETTGLSPIRDSIVQLSCIVMIDHKETERHKWDIKPYKTNGMDPGAALVNGITQEMAMSFPDQSVAFKEFYELLTRLSKEEKGYICGYNVQFDLDMIKAWFEHNRKYDLWRMVDSPVMDVYKYAAFPFILKGVRPYMENFKLTTLYKTIFNKDFEGAHDSMADIEATIEIYKVLVNKYFPEISLE